MGKKKMKLNKVKIVRLHNKFNYELNFNEDLNLIYGTNGCGKTTILNIIAFILNGEIYKLPSYNFEEITIFYYDSKIKDNYKLVIRESHKMEYILIYEEKEYIIDVDVFDTDFSEIEFKERFLDEYDILKTIINKFSCLYLPLNRINMNLENYYDRNYSIRKKRMLFSNYIDESGLFWKNDYAIANVQKMISDFYANANMLINRANDSFKNELLKSLVTVEAPNISDIFNSLKNNNYREFINKKNQYIDVLKKNNLIENCDDYSKFFDEVIEEMKKNENSDSNRISIELLFTLAEMTKIDNIIKLSNSLEKKKQAILKPIEHFCEIINNFFNANNSDKNIKTENGKLYFYDSFANKSIDVKFLSSGEKQIIVFYANLIFGIKNKKPSIVLVDEPELSLHLSWQRIFVEQTLNVDRNIQFIFATHAPELVGKYRDYSLKLEREI